MHAEVCDSLAGAEDFDKCWARPQADETQASHSECSLLSGCSVPHVDDI